MNSIPGSSTGIIRIGHSFFLVERFFVPCFLLVARSHFRSPLPDACGRDQPRCFSTGVSVSLYAVLLRAILQKCVLE